MSRSTVQRVYEFEVVGGPFDGAPSMLFVAHEAGVMFGPGWELPSELPGVILVGRCSGQRQCLMPSCVAGGHVAYWLPGLDEDRAPVGVVEYWLEDASVRIDGRRGWAKYVLGDMPLPGVDVVLAGVGGSRTMIKRWED